jgi:division protein CdvB (Snf7/Vps24/ESCRT-III family)
LVKSFGNLWKSKEKEESMITKIANIGKPSVSLKEQINVVTQRLELQTKTLDNAVQRFEMRDAEIFRRVVKAVSERDNARANILASELSEIRKVEKMLTHASLALQSVSMRLNTVSEMGDLVSILSPAKGVLNGIRTEMCGILPEASQELGNIGGLLSEIVMTTNQGTDIPVDNARASPEAMQILEEAEIAAEIKLKDQLPEINDTGQIQQKRVNREALS